MFSGAGPAQADILPKAVQRNELHKPKKNNLFDDQPKLRDGFTRPPSVPSGQGIAFPEPQYVPNQGPPS